MAGRGWVGVRVGGVNPTLVYICMHMHTCMHAQIHMHTHTHTC